MTYLEALQQAKSAAKRELPEELAIEAACCLLHLQTLANPPMPTTDQPEAAEAMRNFMVGDLNR